jgi:hypothetical protein
MDVVSMLYLISTLQTTEKGLDSEVFKPHRIC